MKSTTAAVALLSATISMAAPTLNSRTPAAGSGYAVPSVVKIHSINNNLNTFSTATSTVRSGDFETSTLYDIPIPEAAAGKTCALVFKASDSDTVAGTGALDISKNEFTDLASLTEGNLRDQQLARIVYDPDTGLFDFDRAAFTATVDSFPCPAGKVLHWEAAAVGEVDTVVIQQDFSHDGAHVPNGLSVAFW
ncbi:hypothetical protein F5Y18DRAFT_435090 [Xylariaceae sp. FL1019]|nr:hypothetical protein F5Y18DRAFT_435090 [Xylariaceae sp. FL1019]